MAVQSMEEYIDELIRSVSSDEDEEDELQTIQEEPDKMVPEQAPAPEQVPAPAPAPETNSKSKPLTLKQKRKNKVLSRAKTLEEDKLFREKIRLSILASGLKLGNERTKEIKLSEILGLPNKIKIDDTEINLTNKLVTLKQSIRNSGLIIIKIKISSQSLSSVFLAHLSFWPEIKLSESHPKTYSNKNFEVFRKGSIHFVLENYKSKVDKRPLTIKVGISKDTQNFYIADEDFDTLNDEIDKDTDNLRDFLNMLLLIINHTKDFFFTGIKGSKTKKRKKRTKKRTKKRKKKSTKKRKKKSTKKSRKKRH